MKTTALRIAGYERLSVSDDARDESLSIKNQREMIKQYISEHGDLADCEYADYVDDGVSGSHTDRAAYQRLLADAERGDVDVIIVKDLSRIGRDGLEVDDLLMNRLVSMSVRFIAIANAYDSFVNPLSNLELAFINLANQHYNRDLAVKSQSAKAVKQKRGEVLGLPPYGYKKSETERNRLVPDEEAAAVVRFMFSMAAEGRRSVEIAQILNAQGVPSPYMYKISHGYKSIWRPIDKNYSFWAISYIRKMIANEVYIGTAAANRFGISAPGKRDSLSRPRDEWIIIPNAHEPLVTEDVFRKAQLILPRIRAEGERAHIFGNKIKCPDCGRAMTRANKNPMFKCGTAKYTDHYGCRSHTILQRDIEAAVIASVRAYAAALIDRQKMNLALIERGKVTAGELETKIRSERKSIQFLESSVTKIFTELASGKITKETFIRKKAVINGEIAVKREAAERMSAELKALTDGRSVADGVIAEITPLVSLETLDRDIVDLLIDKILVHSVNDIEIVWNDRF